VGQLEVGLGKKESGAEVGEKNAKSVLDRARRKTAEKIRKTGKKIEAPGGLKKLKCRQRTKTEKHENLKKTHHPRSGKKRCVASPGKKENV